MLTILPRLTSIPASKNLLAQKNTKNSSTNSSDTFTNSNKNVSFRGLNFYVSHLLRAETYSVDGDLFLNDENRKSIDIPGEVHIIGNSNVKKIKARTVELRDGSASDKINAKYITLFDNSTAKRILAETSACIHTDNKVGSVISGGNVDAQTDKGGLIEQITAKDSILLGQNVTAIKAIAPEVEVINNALAGEINTSLAIISCNSKVNKINSNDSVRVRGYARVKEINSEHHVGLSDECKVGKIVMGGNDAEVHIMDNPQFDNIEFIKGNGKIILHPDYRGDFPEIDMAKIKGGKIEQTGKRAIENTCNANVDIKYIVEYLNNF